MQIVLLGNVHLDNSAISLVEIGEHLQQLLVGGIDSSDQVAHLVLLEVLGEGLETVLHELVDLNCVVVLVAAVDR